MLGYYTELALRSLRRSPILTALMVLAIGLGIGASMTMITVLHVMTADPLPGLSAQLFYPQIDPQDKDGYHAEDKPPALFTWIDAMNLLRDHRGSRQAAMSRGQVTVRPPQGKERAFFESTRFASSEFFNLFDVPFSHGHGWTADDDTKHARVVVLDRKLADKLFGVDRAVGQSVHLGDYSYRVIGVIDHWDPSPHFYDLESQGAFGHSESIYMPLETGVADKQSIASTVQCFGNAGFPSGSLKDAPNCEWLEYWVQLDTPDAAKDYRDYLVHYSQEQMALGRFERPPHVGLHDLMGWLDYNHVIPGSVQLQTLLALGFLLVCLVNTVALLLVKFMRRSSELSVRRAMGASRRDLFAQLLGEAAMIGLGGGLLGLLLAWGGLWIVRQQPAEYAQVAHLDVPMLGVALGLAVLASVLAGVFPAWRASVLPPARGLKLQ
ncbi:ABC transporter permease [Dyella sp.]|uniref:ABC transporter permease n=1 Tax=Dyella sp. TaxID=1869338 RepID=UPI003F7F5E3C